MTSEQRGALKEAKGKIIDSIQKSDFIAGAVVVGEGHVHAFVAGSGDPKTMIMTVQSLREAADAITKPLAEALSEDQLQELFDKVKLRTRSTEDKNRYEIVGEDEE